MKLTFSEAKTFSFGVVKKQRENGVNKRLPLYFKSTWCWILRTMKFLRTHFVKQNSFISGRNEKWVPLFDLNFHGFLNNFGIIFQPRRVCVCCFRKIFRKIAIAHLFTKINGLTKVRHLGKVFEFNIFNNRTHSLLVI